MSARILLAAAVLLLTACGGDDTRREVRLLAPVYVPLQAAAFERETGCEVDARIYDEDEDVEAIARRRNADVVAADRATLDGFGRELSHRTRFSSVSLVRVDLDDGPPVTVPQELGAAFDGAQEPAGTRQTAWAVRGAGPNDDCARRWIAYVRRSSK